MLCDITRAKWRSYKCYWLFCWFRSERFLHVRKCRESLKLCQTVPSWVRTYVRCAQRKYWSNADQIPMVAHMKSGANPEMGHRGRLNIDQCFHRKEAKLCIQKTQKKSNNIDKSEEQLDICLIFCFLLRILEQCSICSELKHLWHTWNNGPPNRVQSFRKHLMAFVCAYAGMCRHNS